MGMDEATIERKFGDKSEPEGSGDAAGAGVFVKHLICHQGDRMGKFSPPGRLFDLGSFFKIR
jgi:hypothetical protein